VKLTSTSTLPEVAVAVGAQLRRHGITAVLTGGACVSVYTDGSYVSKGADFVIQGRVQQATLDGALAELGFVRKGDRYVHPAVEFYLEFPPGPLAIGSDLAIRPAEVSIADEVALALSATDSCRDRRVHELPLKEKEKALADYIVGKPSALQRLQDAVLGSTTSGSGGGGAPRRTVGALIRAAGLSL
jgi:hypothetical protein